MRKIPGLEIQCEKSTPYFVGDGKPTVEVVDQAIAALHGIASVNLPRVLTQIPSEELEVELVQDDSTDGQ